jgi:pyrroloquinoline quinone (PQQ) biosynthesis protein C
VQSDVHEKFADSYQKAAPLCQAIETIRNRHKFNIKIDSKGHFWFDEKETKPFTVQAATTTYSDEEIEFCTKAGEIFDAINDFEKWAKSKGFDYFFTKEQATVWNGGTSIKSIINLLTDVDDSNNTTNHITFNAEVFRKLLHEGFIGKV